MQDATQCMNYATCGQQCDNCQSSPQTLSVPEYKPTKQEIIATMAGELMSAAVRASEGRKIDVFVEYGPHCNQLDFRAFVNGWSIASSTKDLPPEHKESVDLEHPMAVDRLDMLIKKIEALEVSV